MDPINKSDQLFKKPVAVNIYEGGSSYNSLCRKLKLLITVEWSSATTGNLRRELVVRLTDENEPFFIYNLNLGEEDFHSLKTQQGLLVDFLSFPQKFIHLLDLCAKEEHGESPKFVLNLSTSGRLGTDGGVATLDVVETNPFKLLTHLSLKLLPAPDDFIKKFLASSIKSLKEENQRLDTSLRSTQNDLQSRLQSCQRELSNKCSESELKNREMQSEICALSQRHQNQLKEEQERIIQIHRDAESRWALEKHDLELKLSRETQQLEAKNSLLTTSNKDLHERLQKSESSLREVRGHLVSVQSDQQEQLSRLSSVSREVQVLTVQNQEHLKTLSNLRTQLGQAQMEVRDKETQLERAKELLDTTQQQKTQLENLCEQRQAIISKKESAVKTLSEELNKGNDIIRKLQNEIKSYHTKLKQRNQIACKQEEILTERDTQLSRMQNDTLHAQEKLRATQEENAKLIAELNEIKRKNEENLKQLKSNENVISWLNKQLNDVQLGGGRAVALYDSSVAPTTRLPHHATGMTTSTPVYRPTISPTSHPLYRPPILPLQSNITPRFAYNPQPLINGTKKSPLISENIPIQGQSTGVVLSGKPQPPNESSKARVSAEPEAHSKRPQSSDATKQKPRSKPVRQVSSAPVRK